MQAPFDDRFYGAREETDVRFQRRSNSLLATVHHESHEGHEGRTKLSTTEERRTRSFERKERSTINAEIAEIAECRSIRSGGPAEHLSKAAALRRRVESLGDLCASSVNSAFTYVDVVAPGV
jgi:hypothetical protein